MAQSILGSFRSEDVTSKKLNNEIENIHYSKIKEANKNRDIGDIRDLAEDIASDGLDHNLLLRKIEDEKYEYELVAGHRRFNAIKYLIDSGNMNYEYIPCKIKEYEDIDARRRLILNNLNTKGYTQSEMLSVIEELQEIYKTKKENGEKIPGRIQHIISQEVGLGKSQVGNYQSVIKNAISEVKELVENGEMSINVASEISSLDDDEQLMFIEKEDQIDLKTIKEYKKTLQEEVEDFNIDDEEIDVGEEEFEYEEDSEVYEEDEEDIEVKNIALKSMSMNECITLIDTSLLKLRSKLLGVEWKEENIRFDNVVTAFEDLKDYMGIYND